MATDTEKAGAQPEAAARTGEQFLEGLRSGEREVWLNGEQITHPAGAARSCAPPPSRWRASSTSSTSTPTRCSPRRPTTGALVNVTHVIPRSREDLERRRRAIELTASLSGRDDGADARLPERHVRLLRRPRRRLGAAGQRAGRREPRRLPAAHARRRPLDDARAHEPSGRPHEAGGRAGRRARSRCTRSTRPTTRSSSAARGCSRRSRRSPTSCSIYPGSDIRPQDGRYALSFAIPIATPGLKFICRDSYSKQRPAYDYPLSSRFDEMDCVVIFDDVEVPKERVFLDGDTVGYSEVITDTGWRGHIMHQAFTRAYVKLCFAFGLGHLIANTIGVVRFDHIQEKLGQIWNMCELTRSALVAGRGGLEPRRGRRLVPRRPAVPGAPRRDAQVAAARERAPPADRRRRLHGHALAGRPGRAAAPAASTRSTRRPAPTRSGGSGSSGSPGTTSAPTSAAAASCTSASTSPTPGG